MVCDRLLSDVKAGSGSSRDVPRCAHGGGAVERTQPAQLLSGLRAHGGTSKPPRGATLRVWVSINANPFEMPEFLPETVPAIITNPSDFSEFIEKPVVVSETLLDGSAEEDVPGPEAAGGSFSRARAGSRPLRPVSWCALVREAAGAEFPALLDCPHLPWLRFTPSSVCNGGDNVDDAQDLLSDLTPTAPHDEVHSVSPGPSSAADTDSHPPSK